MSTLKPAAKPRLNSAFKQLMSLHWAMSACYLVLFISGTSMARLPRELFVRGTLYDFHKSLGVLTMALLTLRILTLLRVWWKKYTKRLPKFTKEWYKTFALHATLYVFMWLVPVAGFLLSNSYKSNNVKFFGIVLPDMFPQNSAIVEVGRSLHFWLGYTFLAFVILHILDRKKVVRANWRRFTNFVRNKFPKSQKAG
ncbi:cytochrome b/b6 domain-containing protein [Microcoleus sp. AT9_B5]